MWKLRFLRILLFTRGVTSPQPFVPTSGEMEIDVMGSWDLSFTDCHRFPFNQTLYEGRIPGRIRCFSLSSRREITRLANLRISPPPRSSPIFQCVIVEKKQERGGKGRKGKKRKEVGRLRWKNWFLVLNLYSNLSGTAFLEENDFRMKLSSRFIRSMKSFNLYFNLFPPPPTLPTLPSRQNTR